MDPCRLQSIILSTQLSPPSMLRSVYDSFRSSMSPLFNHINVMILNPLGNEMEKNCLSVKIFIVVVDCYLAKHFGVPEIGHDLNDFSHLALMMYTVCCIVLLAFGIGLSSWERVDVRGLCK